MNYTVLCYPPGFPVGGDDFFFFQRKNGSYLLKNGVFLVLVRLESSRDEGEFVTGIRQCFVVGKCTDGPMCIHSS